MLKKIFIASLFVVAALLVKVFLEPYVERPLIEAPIVVKPEVIYPGDPVFITINSTSTVKGVSIGGKRVETFSFKEKPRVLWPVDFTLKQKDYEVRVDFTNGLQATTTLAITPRVKIEKPLGIPAKLGGNTKEASNRLMNNLAKENYELNNLSTATTSLWSQNFIYPVTSVFVTDDYGYSRQTVGETILHKGTDFRAATGTNIFAMNDGVVRLAREYTVYGRTIVIDHGLGLQTLYMHLSEIKIKEGQMVKAGQIIGLSGETGYASAPHLHISVKIKGISIDPITFLSFFQATTSSPKI